jgi:hypothetical protein
MVRSLMEVYLAREELVGSDVVVHRLLDRRTAESREPELQLLVAGIVRCEGRQERLGETPLGEKEVEELRSVEDPGHPLARDEPTGRTDGCGAPT